MSAMVGIVKFVVNLVIVVVVHAVSNSFHCISCVCSVFGTLISIARRALKVYVDADVDAAADVNTSAAPIHNQALPCDLALHT